MKITFENFARKQGIVLHPWQKQAAKAFLRLVHKNRAGATGKTVLVNLLRDFVNEHGSDFALRASPGQPPVKLAPAKRKLFTP